MTKKCHIIKNMPNRKKNKKKIFLLLLRTECISLYHCLWYHYFWYQMKDKLICDKAKKNSDQNNHPIKKYSTFCKGNEKWEILQTTVKDKNSA